MRMKICHLFIFCILLPQLVKAKIPVVPYPQQIEKTGDSFVVDQNINLKFSLKDTTKWGIGINEIVLALGKYCSSKPKINKASYKTIHFGFPPKDKKLRKALEQANLWPNSQIGDEGYVFQISPDKILIAANKPAGLYYGIQTLKQLLRGSTNSKLPCVKIVDWPDFKFRGMEDDISRGPVPTMAFFKQQIRRCAELKLNALCYYTENIVKTKKHSDFAPVGGGVTIEQFKELAEYADKYFIQLVGNFQSFGHFENILSYPQYAHLGEANRMLSPVNEESYQLLADIYGEMAPAFSSLYFNVNCDETWDLGRGASKKLVDSLGIANVYAQHMNRISSELKKHDKTMMMWADIALEHPQMLELLPKETVMLSWNYGALESFDFMIEPLQKAGFRTIICPGIVNSRRIMPDFEVTRKNIYSFLRDGKKNDVMGVLLTVWDEGRSAMFSRDWYGVAYSADQSWHVGDKSDKSYDKRFDLAVYGDRKQTLSKAIQTLIPLTHLAATQEMNEAVFWNKTVPDLNTKFKINLNDWYAVEEVCQNALNTLEAASATDFSTDFDYIKLSINQYSYLAKSRIDLVKAADFYRQACLHQNDPERCRNNLGESLELVTNLRASLIQLTDFFQQMWLGENRAYYLNYILDEYWKKQIELEDTITRLKNAINDYSNGHFLLPPDLVRLDIKESKNNYFSSWLLCGPFPNPEYTGKEIDYLKTLGGEANAHPTVYSETEWPAGTKTRWRKFTSPVPTEIDLVNHYENNRKVIAYAYCRIESEIAQKVKATFGSNDGIEIILNGKQVFKKLVKRNLMPDENEVKLDLQSGQNYLMLKIYQGNGGWGFSFQIPNLKIRNHDYKYRIINE